MRGIWFMLAVMAGLLTSAHAKISLNDLNDLIDGANLQVNHGCSGTLIDATKLTILTAYHCVSDQYETIEREKIDDDGVVKNEKVRIRRDGTVTQIFFDGPESVRRVVYKVKLLAGDKDKDLALLQIRAKGVTPQHAATIACNEPRRGEAVYIVGNPTGSLYSSLTTGIVSSLQRDYDILPFDNDNPKQPLMQVSGGIVGGNSGGSVLNTNGELIGVPVIGHRMNEVIGFAVPLPVIKEFLKANNLDGLYQRCEPPSP